MTGRIKFLTWPSQSYPFLPLSHLRHLIHNRKTVFRGLFDDKGLVRCTNTRRFWRSMEHAGHQLSSPDHWPQHSQSIITLKHPRWSLSSSKPWTHFAGFFGDASSSTACFSRVSPSQPSARSSTRSAPAPIRPRHLR